MLVSTGKRLFLSLLGFLLTRFSYLPGAMRMIGTISDERAARRFGDALYVHGIPNELEAGAAGVWEVWVKADDDCERASDLLQAYGKNAADPAFHEASEQAAKVRKLEQADLERYRKRVANAGKLLPGAGARRFGVLTYSLIAICVLVFLYMKMGDNSASVRKLFYSEFQNSGSWWERIAFVPEVRAGEVWRLLTPIFLHFSFVHILFNLMWMMDLGTTIESRHSTWLLARLVLGIGIGSNLIQYAATGHPAFGGMSGVVYGLIGYIWMRGKFDPACGLFLNKQTVVMALIWFFVCLVGIIPNVANGAHGGGLAIGMAWGWLASQRKS